MTEKEEVRQLSVHVSKELEKLGFSRHKLEAKSSEVRILEHLENDGRTIQIFATGSNSEGVDISGSDRDTMVVLGDACAVWSSEEIHNLLEQPNITVFEIDQTGTRPCYAKLRLVRESSRTDDMFHILGGKGELCIQTQDGDWYLSSERFVREANVYTSNQFQSSSIHTMHAFHVHGPCATFDNIVGKTTFETDFAFAIPCHSLLEQPTSLTQRHVKCNWPTEEIVQFGRNTGCHLVPVGGKVSDSDDLEWRISFVLLERELVWSLEDMHCKCYVLLKMLIKQFIEPLAPEQLSSYLIKTALLWLKEEGQIAEEEDKLIENTFKCLEKLRTCIQQRILPHYVIPENNLLLTKFEDENTKVMVVEMLSEMTSWHWVDLLQCKALSSLQDLWDEFEPDFKNFLRHARHPNMKPLVYKDVTQFRSIQSMYMSVCNITASQDRHLKMLISMKTLPTTVENQTVNLLSKIICNRILFVIADLDDMEVLYRQTKKDNDTSERNKSSLLKASNNGQVMTPVEEGAILEMTQESLRMTSDDNTTVPAAKQWLATKFDACTLDLQLAIKLFLHKDYNRVHAQLQEAMAAYKPQVLYIGLCGPEEVGELDIIEYLCYVTASGNMSFHDKVCKCLAFDYVICRCDPILPIFKRELMLWQEEEVPVCVHPRVLIHYLMFLVHLYQDRPASALASLSFLLLNVQGTTHRPHLYGHIGWNLVGHGHFLMGKTNLALRAFRKSLKVKDRFNPAIYYISNC